MAEQLPGSPAEPSHHPSVVLAEVSQITGGEPDQQISFNESPIKSVPSPDRNQASPEGIGAADVQSFNDRQSRQSTLTFNGN